MKIPWANVNYASEMRSVRAKKEGFTFCLLTAFILFCLLISPAAAAAADWKITPTSPSVGDTLKVTGTASPNTDIRAEVTFIKNLPVSQGRYQLTLNNLQVPNGKNNLFTVSADGVKNLHVGVTIILFTFYLNVGPFNLNADATNGVATISQGHVPAWSYNIVIDGDAPGKSSVQLQTAASQTLTADSKGKFEFSYDTSALPAGVFSVKIDNQQVKTVEFKPKGQKK